MSAQANTNCHDIFNVVLATRTHMAKIGATCHVVQTCHDMLATFPAKLQESSGFLFFSFLSLVLNWNHDSCSAGTLTRRPSGIQSVWGLRGSYIVNEFEKNIGTLPLCAPAAHSLCCHRCLCRPPLLLPPPPLAASAAATAATTPHHDAATAGRHRRRRHHRSCFPRRRCHCGWAYGCTLTYTCASGGQILENWGKVEPK